MDVSQGSTVSPVGAGPGVDVSGLSDTDLGGWVSTLLEEQRQRALLRCDPDALVDAGFADGFDAKGFARQPWLVEGMLVCPGSVVERSATGHDCVFVSVDGVWVFNCEDRVVDVVRKVPAGAREHQRSVTVLAASEGSEFDVVSSRMRDGKHRMRGVRRFRVENSALVLVSDRATSTPPPASSH